MAIKVGGGIKITSGLTLEAGNVPMPAVPDYIPAFTSFIPIPPAYSNPQTGFVVANGATNYQIILSGNTGTPYTSAAVYTQPSNGTVTITGTNIYYTPASSWSGADSFVLALSAGGATQNVTVRLTVLAQVPNYTSTQNFSVGYASSNNIITLTGNSVASAYTSVAVVTQPAHGTVAITGTNISYTPISTYLGADSFVLTLINSGGSEQITVNMTVVAPAPNYTSTQNFSVGPGSSIITLTGNSVAAAYTSATVVTQPTHGTVAITGTNISYTPAAGWSGPDSFVLNLTNSGGSEQVTVSVTTTTVVTVNYLVVGGGGGGGGTGISSGGGGGGMLSGSTTLNVGVTYTIYVGVGGAGGSKFSGSVTNGGQSGQPSYISGSSLYITAQGGGGSGVSGGSGAGGATGGGTAGTGGAGLLGPGNPGGKGVNAPTPTGRLGGGGGGGGAGGMGFDAGAYGSLSYIRGGCGGSGRLWPYTGAYYAGGGGGGGYGDCYGGGGGRCGGGRGGATGSSPSIGIPGLANFGSGGGGGSGYAPLPGAGGAGGSGVVILATPSSQVGTVASGSGSISNAPPAYPGMKLVTFTGPGTYKA
jgi:hypothetical protein